MHPDLTLQDIQLDPGDPARIPDLMAAPPERLSASANALARQIRAWSKNAQGLALDSPSAVGQALREGHIVWRTDRWQTYAVDSYGGLLRTALPDGRTRMRVAITEQVPDADDLPEVPPGGKYVLVWSGSADRVGTSTGVAHRLRALTHTPGVFLADVMLYDPEHEGGPALWSLVAGEGEQAGKQIDLPEGEVLSAVVMRR